LWKIHFLLLEVWADVLWLPATPNPAARRPVNWPRSGCEEGVHAVAWLKSNPLLFILQDQAEIRLGSEY
jgi:hypothetical protein